MTHPLFQIGNPVTINYPLYCMPGFFRGTVTGFRHDPELGNECLEILLDGYGVTVNIPFTHCTLVLEVGDKVNATLPCPGNPQVQGAILDISSSGNLTLELSDHPQLILSGLPLKCCSLCATT